MSVILILSISSLLIALINGIFVSFFLKKRNYEKSKKDGYVDFSIIIAFKDEAKNLNTLFSTLEKLVYPQTQFEVILVDDGSTDNSLQIAIEFSKNYSNYKVFTAKNKKYPGKKGALDIGVNQAHNNFIMITDADCKPSSNWLACYSENFNLGFDVLFGPAPFEQKEKFINKISCFENLRSSILTISLAELNLTYSAAARNFGFTISTYNKLGGYGNTIETLSGDDDLFLREAVKNKLRIGVVKDEDALVWSDSKSNLKDYINQKARHTKTSFFYLPHQKLILGFWHSLNILLVLSLLLVSINLLLIIPFFIKIISDIIAVRITQKKFKYSFNLFEIIFFQIVYELFFVINFLFAFKKNIIWKNQ